MALTRPILLVVALAATPARDAAACAVMPVEAGGTPNLTTERVVLLYDEARKTEHFVREVRFDGASSTFAFVVPTPSQPEVAAVKAPPFDALESAFPLEPPPEPPSQGLFAGGAKSAAAAPVEVLSSQRVGKFTAFVLAASDPAALSKWLTDNKIAVPPGGREWLQHYVGLGFYFAAFRYDAPEGVIVINGPGASSMTSETVRLTFAAPVPFFPYLEPARGANTQGLDHTMEVWLVSRHERAPQLRREAAGQSPRWAWPWQAGIAYEKPSSEVARPLGELGKLVQEGAPLHVQTFRDRRINRDGWGDILFPVKDAPLEEPSWLNVAQSMLGDLDRGLHVGRLEELELANEERFRVAPSAGGCACDLAARSEGSGGWLGLLGLGALSLARRRRRDQGPAASASAFCQRQSSIA